MRTRRSSQKDSLGCCGLWSVHTLSVCLSVWALPLAKRSVRHNACVKPQKNRYATRHSLENVWQVVSRGEVKSLYVGLSSYAPHGKIQVTAVLFSSHLRDLLWVAVHFRLARLLPRTTTAQKGAVQIAAGTQPLRESATATSKSTIPTTSAVFHAG